MVVTVGPYQRIVGVSWPMDNPEDYYSAIVNFVSGTTYGTELNTSVPYDDFPTTIRIADTYVTSITPRFNLGSLLGVPSPTTYSYGAWAYCGQGVLGGYFETDGGWSAPAFALIDETAFDAPRLTIGPTVDGVRALDLTSFSLHHYFTPFLGTQKYRILRTGFSSNLHMEVAAVRYTAADPIDNDLAATVEASISTQNFSGVYFNDGTSDWNVIGLWFEAAPSQSGMFNQLDNYYVRLLFKRQPP